MKILLMRTVAALMAAAVLFSDTACAAPRVSARQAVLLDSESGSVLWSKCAEEKALIASTTKIMTCILAAEMCDPEETVEIPAAAVGVEGSSAGLKAYETLTVKTLLYGLMLASGNDAAAALAIHCSGSLDVFVEEMNQKAELLGLHQTHYANPHGLDSEDNYSSALDLAMLTSYAMKNPLFREIVSTKTVQSEGRYFSNHNKLLWRYDGAVGVKTGYTKAAGRVLVSCAERDGHQLIAVTISAPDDWQDHCCMLDYGFSSFSQTVIAKKGAALLTIPVIGGADECAAVCVQTDVLWPVEKDHRVQVSFACPEFVFPPVIAGTQAGTMIVEYGGTVVKRVPLFWNSTVMEGA